jgi:GT2 family glycosyltransferase
MVNDCSRKPHIRRVLDEYAERDQRIKVHHLGENLGIAAASNRALELSSGDFVGFLDHDDELTTDALFEVVRRLNENSEIDIVYSDEDKLDSASQHCEPFFKPDWSPEFFRGVMYVGHLLVARRELINAVGGLDRHFNLIQDYELMLRLSERARRISHVAQVLYHWRRVPGSIAQSPHEKGDVEALQTEAVNLQLKRRGIAGKARSHPRLSHRVIVEPLARSDWPRVSIIIPTKDAPEQIGRCLDSLYQKTTYRNFEVIVVDNNTTDPQALRAMADHSVKIVRYEHEFNFSAANNLGAKESEGDYLILLNNDTEVVTHEWIEWMLMLLEQADVGAVGPLLTYPDDSVQHAGIVLGFRGTADHVMRSFPREADGYFGSLRCAREVSAVTGACLMIKKRDYLDNHGLEESYRTIYQDVDLCLRLRASGKRILVQPNAVLIHYESVSRGETYDFLDRALLLDVWGETIDAGDPYFNRNLSLLHHDYTPRYIDEYQ